MPIVRLLLLVLATAGCNLQGPAAATDAVDEALHGPKIINPARIGPKTFDDDFKVFDHGVDQERPDKPHRWRTVYGGDPKSPYNRTLVNNLEDQVYIDPEFGGLNGCPPLGIDPFSKEPAGIAVHARRLNEAQKKCLGFNWSSGVMTTIFSFEQKWGYFEGDLDVPTQKGFWPGFWLVPSKGGWPDAGEIDILEAIGTATPGGVAKRSVNTVFKSPTTGKRDENQHFTSVITPGFHRYGVLWTPRYVAFYLDRKLEISVPTPPGYDQPMHFILSLTVGLPNSWPGAPEASVSEGVIKIRRISAWSLASAGDDKGPVRGTDKPRTAAPAGVP